jgi:hypothetical protein
MHCSKGPQLPGLPDGVFAYHNNQFWYILEGLGFNKCGIHIFGLNGVFSGF